MSMERIANAAILRDGVAYTGRRHHAIIAEHGVGGTLKNCPQGFVTDSGRFVDRKEACRIAIASGQVQEKDMTVHGTLFSEDLW